MPASIGKGNLRQTTKLLSAFAVQLAFNISTTCRMASSSG